MAFKKDVSIQTYDKNDLVLSARYQISRHFILLFIALMITDAICLLTLPGMSFILSAYIPHLIMDLAMTISRVAPGDIFTVTSLAKEPLILFACIFILAIALLALLLWFLARKHSAWIYIMIALIGIDAAVMIFMIPLADAAISAAVHALVILLLIWGVANRIRFKIHLKKTRSENHDE